MKKHFSGKHIRIVQPTLDLICTDTNVHFEYLSSLSFGDHIVNFASVMVEHFSIENLMIFYKNINTLKVRTKKFKLQNFVFNDSAMAEYDTIINQINMGKDIDMDVIYHELFHMASSFIKNGVLYSGFHQFCIFKKINFGVGLDEGYTELLRIRYFSNLGRDFYPFEFKTWVAYVLELSVGQEVMEGLYLNADLKGLILELQDCSSLDEILNFLSKLDFYYYYYVSKKKRSRNVKMIIESMECVVEFLLKSYVATAKKYLGCNDSSIEELSFYIACLKCRMRAEDFQFQFLKDDWVYETVDSVFGSSDLVLRKVKDYLELVD